MSLTKGHAEIQPYSRDQLSPVRCSEKAFPIGLRICLVHSLMPAGLVSKSITGPHVSLLFHCPHPLFCFSFSPRLIKIPSFSKRLWAEL